MTGRHYLMTFSSWLIHPARLHLAVRLDSALYVLEESSACEVICQALTLWTTHVHPTLLPLRFGAFRQDQPDCLLLACIQFELNAVGEVIFNLEPDGTLISGDIQVLDCDRPIIVPDRLKQELFCPMGYGTGSGAEMNSPQGFTGLQELTGLGGPPAPAGLIGTAIASGTGAVLVKEK
jgi:hypothetical protein